MEAFNEIALALGALAAVCTVLGTVFHVVKIISRWHRKKKHNREKENAEKHSHDLQIKEGKGDEAQQPPEQQ